MKENKIIFITMILNLFIACTKLFVGLFFSFSTLIADSVQSFIDFVTDITSIIVNKIGKRRANHNYPFGYGQAYCVSNIFTGFLLFLIGIFILYQFFFFEGGFHPNATLILVLLLVFCLKFVVVFLLFHFGKSYKSEFMIEAAGESRADLISTAVVIVVTFLSLFESYLPSFINLDKIGCFGMVVYVFYTSFKMILANMHSILTHTEDNAEIKKEVENEIKKHKHIELKSVTIIKMYTYYHIIVKIYVGESLTIKKYLELEKELIREIHKKDNALKFIDIEPITRKKEKNEEVL
ncbi:MAG: cation diffusion facilitator family transporter [Bacilli bacterium]|nr:cation diffusion facilitator family transporter [Bacilli bacterium]